MVSGLIQLLNNWGIPREAAVNATFYPIACFTLLAAILVVISRNIFHCALYLTFTLIGVACVYLYLDAEFLAVVQVLIYVGAIVTLFIFTIMLTADINTGPARGMTPRILISALGSLAILSTLFRVIVRSGWRDLPPQDSSLSLQELGRSLMSKYVLPFEVISLISLAALVGAIVIGRVGKR